MLAADPIINEMKHFKNWLEFQIVFAACTLKHFTRFYFGVIQIGNSKSMGELLILYCCNINGMFLLLFVPSSKLISVFGATKHDWNGNEEKLR